MCRFISVRSVVFLDRWFLDSGLDTVLTRTITGVNSRANSVQQQQKPSSRTPACFPGTAGLLGCWLDCLGLAHPVKTLNIQERMSAGQVSNEDITCRNELKILCQLTCIEVKIEDTSQVGLQRF